MDLMASSPLLAKAPVVYISQMYQVPLLGAHTSHARHGRGENWNVTMRKYKPL